MILSITLYILLTAVMNLLAAGAALEEDRPGWFCFLGAMVVWAAFNLYAINQ